MKLENDFLKIWHRIVRQKRNIYFDATIIRRNSNTHWRRIICPSQTDLIAD